MLMSRSTKPNRASRFEQTAANKYRALADAEANIRTNLSKQSQDAFSSGRKAEAKLLSNKAKLHAENMKRYNQMANEAALHELNKEQHPTTFTRIASFLGIIAANENTRYNELDLHGCDVNYAIQAVTSHLQNCIKHQYLTTVIITGRGNNSVDKIARIKPVMTCASVFIDQYTRC